MDSVRSVALGFWIGTGSSAEDAPEAGLSHLIEHMLFRGTARYGSLEIDQMFDAMGAELNAGTGKETTSVYARVLDVHLAQAFDVMADMVWRPRFDAAELDQEREIVIEEIAMYEDDPQDKVFDVLGEAVFGTHPLGRAIIGRAEVVGGTPAPALRAFHAARYVPANVVVAAAGSVDHDALVDLVRTSGVERPGQGAPARGRPPGPGAPRPPRRAARRPAAHAVHRQGHRAVPRLPRRAGHRARRRPALRAARPRQHPGRHVVVAAVPGGAREARARLQRLLVPVDVRRHGPGRPVPRHAAGQRRARDGRRRRRARAHARGPGERRRARALEGERKGPDRAVARVDGGADEPARRIGAGRHAAHERRRGHRAHRRGDARRHRRARPRAVRAGAHERGRHRLRCRGLPPRGRAHLAGTGRGPRVIRVGVAGAAGRMGQAVCAAVEAADDMTLAGRADPALGVKLADILDDCDVVVDFTVPATALENARACVRAGVHAVVGTTGWDPAELAGETG